MILWKQPFGGRGRQEKGFAFENKSGNACDGR
jgi:hypothetical protein